jgi:hypothetical protein
LLLNRKTSDGTILDLRKDGTTVGSIGTGTGSKQYIGGVSGDGALSFNQDGGVPQLIPANNTGSIVDNTVTLGNPSYRFKDLYLSGTLTNNGTGGINIDTSGNVGIGTTDPSTPRKFDVLGNASDTYSTSNSITDNVIARFRNGSDSSSAQRYGGISLESGNAQFALQTVQTGTYVGDLTFKTRTGSSSYSERMRIDSSGNLLVGKTSSTSSILGCELSTDGRAMLTRNGGLSLLLNRTSSDGTILEFRKDNSVVGSIGTRSNSIYIGLGDTGISFTSNDDAVYPVNPSGLVTRDAAIDLGVDTVRFKDLYLSGGVYLGGTGSANYLDDYEEGTFEVTAVPATSGTATVNSSYNTLSYTKIGRLVTITGDIRISSFSSAVGHLLLYGLPFTVASLTDGAGRAFTATYFYQGSTAAVSAEILYVADGLTRLQIFKDTNTMTNNSEIGIAISYMSA